MTRNLKCPECGHVFKPRKEKNDIISDALVSSGAITEEQRKKAETLDAMQNNQYTKGKAI